MEYKLVRESNKPTISIDEIKEEVDLKGNAFYYFSYENDSKDIDKLKNSLNKAGYNLKSSTIKYSIDKSDFLYEIHVIKR